MFSKLKFSIQINWKFKISKLENEKFKFVRLNNTMSTILKLIHQNLVDKPVRVV